jgi:Zn finger protein HypA/HybF involved in hydrogenase expression
MALIPCHECGAQISNDATKCPKCGATNKKVAAMQKVYLGAVVLAVLVFLLEWMLNS